MQPVELRRTGSLPVGIICVCSSVVEQAACRAVGPWVRIPPDACISSSVVERRSEPRGVGTTRNGPLAKAAEVGCSIHPWCTQSSLL